MRRFLVLLVLLATMIAPKVARADVTIPDGETDVAYGEILAWACLPICSYYSIGMGVCSSDDGSTWTYRGYWSHAFMTGSTNPIMDLETTDSVSVSMPSTTTSCNNGAWLVTDSWHWSWNVGISIYGGSGWNVIEGSPLDDSLIGGEDWDDIYGSGGADYIFGGAEADYLYGGNAVDHIYGGDGNDRIWGDSGADYLYGGDDNDRLYGGVGDDHLYGNGGIDQLYGEGDADVLYLGSSAYCIGESDYGPEYAYGDTGPGDEGDDVIYGCLGDDTIHGNGGRDSIFGNDGDDTIYGGDGSDEISGGLPWCEYDEDDGDDYILGGTTAGDEDKAYGCAGGDTIVLNGGENYGFAYGGDYYGAGSSASDVVDCGCGYSYCGVGWYTDCVPKSGYECPESGCGPE